MPRDGRAFSTVHYLRTFVFIRGLSFGGVGGGVMGAVAGSFFMPIIGTVIGLIYGVVIGLAVGAPCAATLALVSPKLPDAESASAAGAVIGLVWSAVVVSCFDVMQLDDVFDNSPARTVVFALLGAIVGSMVGPRATFARERALQRAEENPFVVGAP